MDKKLHVAVIFGGRSGEHEVSLMSARSVLSVLDPAKYEVTQVGITHEGTWLTGMDVLDKFERNQTDGLLPVLVSPDPSDRGLYIMEGISGLKRWSNVDVYFPVLHGTFGEDGTLQGLFELADVAYVGAGVVGSSVGMDKGVFKDVMIANHIPVVDMMIVLRAEIESDMLSLIERAEKVSDYPLFTK
ncbi:MAG TPA: D-alanine--D-alanine ligase A, partial [Anaerolineales bacterium]|nr:D-alanine--D-alanine ligase A [Anaerolineales bacterium]